MTTDRPGRSEEEREAARLARERARAERAAREAGRPEAAKPAKSPKTPRWARRAKPPEPEPAREPQPARERQPAREPQPAPERQPRREPGPASEPRPAPAPQAAPEPLGARAPQPASEPQAAPGPQPGRAPQPAREPSSGPVVPSRASVRERVDRLLQERAGGGRDPAGPRPPRGRRRLIALAVLGVLVVAALWFLSSLFQPFKGDGGGGELVAVTIPRGAGVGEIGDLLEKRGVVDSGFFFEIRATLGGRRGDLKPGIYNLRRDMSYGAALDSLTGGPPPNLLNVTIPEGAARREVAPRIRSAGVEGNYVRASERSRLVNPRRYGAARARNLEGFLFPATYQMRRGQSARQLVGKQLTAFKREWAKVDLRAARRANLTPYDVLIIASLVEREAQLDKERPLVASVIYNRLREGMNLGIDATVRYALNNWTKPLRRSELASPSSYNTYNHPGLPPGPIGNPGLASMRAAARPARTGYLFYVVKPGTCGEHVFAETGDEHDRNVERYRRAQEANGGRSPTTC